MTVAATLLLVALALGTVAGPVLQRTAWPTRAPRQGILAWQALTACTVLALALAGVAAVCFALMDGRRPVAMIGSLGGGTLALGVVAAVALRVTCSLVSARRHSGHLARGTALAVGGLGEGIVVLDRSDLAAYSIPGRRPVVVVTSGAREVLAHAELRAVLAHEQAHLDRRHHRTLTVAAGLRSALGAFPTFARAEQQLARLVEMEADDAAAASTDRRTVVHALGRLAGALHPAPALGAGGVVVDRVRRLVGTAPLSPGRARLAGSLGVAAPLALVAAFATTTGQAVVDCVALYSPL